MSDFQIKTGVFEGPLELLLSLIEKRKLFINDISLAEVADEYIAHVEKAGQFPMHDVAQFVLVASTLVLIKSRSLLPEFTLSTEEEADIQDLQERLRLYKQAQELAIGMRALFGKQISFLPGVEARPRATIFAPHTSITVANMQLALDSILSRLPKKEVLKQAVVEKIMSLEEMIGKLSGRIQNALTMRFKDFAKAHHAEGATTREVKVNTIVSFLAMLELVKRGVLMVRQHEDFADIEMEHGVVGTPSYDSAL